MRWPRVLLLAGLMSLGWSAEAAPRDAGCPAVVQGEVMTGKHFAAPFGRELEFALEPVAHGWVIRVHPRTSAGVGDVDFAEAVTPPFRSINPLLLTTDFGFRAQDVIGWNPRSFHFVADVAHYRAAAHAEAEAVRGGGTTSDATSAVAAAVAASEEGRLEILDARLVPGTGDQSAAASLLARHFLTTAHTIESVGAAGALGQVRWIRFRVTLGGERAMWGSAGCRLPR